MRSPKILLFQRKFFISVSQDFFLAKEKRFCIIHNNNFFLRSSNIISFLYIIFIPCYEHIFTLWFSVYWWVHRIYSFFFVFPFFMIHLDFSSFSFTHTRMEHTYRCTRILFIFFFTELHLTEGNPNGVLLALPYTQKATHTTASTAERCDSFKVLLKPAV